MDGEGASKAPSPAEEVWQSMAGGKGRVNFPHGCGP